MAEERKIPHGNTSKEWTWEQGNTPLKVDNSLQGGCGRHQPGAVLGEANEWQIACRRDGGRKDILEGDERDVCIQRDTGRESNE